MLGDGWSSAPARTRTLDPVIKSHLLYQLSYKGGQVCFGILFTPDWVCYPPWPGLQVQVALVARSLWLGLLFRPINSILAPLT